MYIEPMRKGTGGARHYAALVFGLTKVVGPLAVLAVACKLAHAVTRMHCCVQACTGCHKQNPREWPMVFITNLTPFLLDVLGAGRC